MTLYCTKIIVNQGLCVCVLFLCCFFALFLSVEAAQDTQQIKEELLQAYNRQLKVIENISFDFQLHAYYRSGNKPLALSYKDEGYCHLDNVGKQLFQRINRTQHNEKEGKDVFKNTQMIQILQSFDKQFLVIQKNDNSVIFNSWLKKQFVESDILLATGFGPTFGHFITVENDSSKLNSFADIIDVATVFVDTNNNSGDNSLIRIEAQVGKFQIKMWFSPSQSYAIKKIQKTSLGVSHGAELLSGEEVVTDYKLINDIYLPSKVQSVARFSSGKVKVRNEEIVDTPETEDKIEYSLSNFQVNHKNDFMITDIPNGTAVYMQDAPQIQYVWNNGKVEPKTDELMLKIARGNHKFIPGVEEPRFWIMALGVIFIIVGFSLKVKTLIQQWREK